MREEAIFAGGCFWCTEWVFREQTGVLTVESGYTGGTLAHPRYEEVCEGTTGHFEAIRILFDPEVITYWQLLESFWFHIDPFDFEGQFFDKGPQYKTAIFFHNAKQKRLARESKVCVEQLFNKTVATQILPAQHFYPAESYHQGYCVKNPDHFKRYAFSHEQRLKELWEGRYALPVKNVEDKLTPLQYLVTQGKGTEAAFHNAYWDNKEEGIYVDLISGVPLFSSKDKFDSGTGWPSFTKPINSSTLIEQTDYQLFTPRTEIISASSGAHLGHVFPDGPPPTHTRYCMNSSALRFFPKTLK